MCGRYGFVSPKDEVEVWERFELANKPKIQSSYNIAPTMKGLVVSKHSPNQGHYMAFGIEASWKPGMRLINAKSETVAELRTFSRMFRESRCIIPATFFFEWKKTAEGKQPYCFKFKDEKMFSFAGLYNESGFVILTTAPNSMMEPVHNRQPLILGREDEEEWLNIDTEGDRLFEIMNPTPASHMEKYKISSLVNSPKNQTSEVIKPITQ